MQEDLKKIRHSLSLWSMSLKKALESNSVDDIKELIKDTQYVQCSCDQLVFCLYQIKEMLDENEISIINS